jgi:hypothetical protein
MTMKIKIDLLNRKTIVFDWRLAMAVPLTHLEIPDDLRRKLVFLADQQDTTVDQLILDSLHALTSDVRVPDDYGDAHEEPG